MPVEYRDLETAADQYEQTIVDRWYPARHRPRSPRAEVARESLQSSRLQNFRLQHLNVLRVGDANDIDRIEATLGVFVKTKGRPTLVVLDSHTGYGSPHKQDTAAAHGDPLGDEEVRLTKRNYGWPENETFFVPAGVYDRFAEGIGNRGNEARQLWIKGFRAVPSGTSRPRKRDHLDAAPRTTGWLGPQPSCFSSGFKRYSGS
jgi:transketolase